MRGRKFCRATISLYTIALLFVNDILSLHERFMFLHKRLFVILYNITTCKMRFLVLSYSQKG